MNIDKTMKISVEEFCQTVDMPKEFLIEIVEHGIIEPQGKSSENWVFDQELLPVVKSAVRLKRDLGIDWTGIALALDLIRELEELRRENTMLKQRLGRFLQD